MPDQYDRYAPQFQFLLRARSDVRGISELAGVVDTYPEEMHDVSSEKTSYPLESGASISDHLVTRPSRLTLTGFVSDLLPAPGVSDALPPSERGPAAWQALRDLHDAKVLVDVQTLLGEYQDMAIMRAATTMNDRTGMSLRFTIELEQFQFREVRREQVQAGDDGASTMSSYEDYVIGRRTVPYGHPATPIRGSIQIRDVGQQLSDVSVAGYTPHVIDPPFVPTRRALVASQAIDMQVESQSLALAGDVVSVLTGIDERTGLPSNVIPQGQITMSSAYRQTMSVSLSGQDCIIDLYWMPLTECWCVNVDKDGERLVSGRQITVGQPLVRHVGFDGDLVVSHADGGGVDPLGPDAWTADPPYQLQYVRGA